MPTYRSPASEVPLESQKMREEAQVLLPRKRLLPRSTDRRCEEAERKALDPVFRAGPRAGKSSLLIRKGGALVSRAANQ